MARPPALRRAATLLGGAVALAGALAGCGRTEAGPAPAWKEIPYGALVAGVASQPYVAAVQPGGPGRPWLLGGAVVDPGGTRRVRIWSAPSPAGPWRAGRTVAVPGRDGPLETIEGLARGPAGTNAFGYRLSPDEGYPRPSTWLAAGPGDPPWREIGQDVEFFGGPDIISFGGMSEGPHGCFVAGTWTGPSNRPVISVWRSGDGLHWSHDFSAPAFAGRPGEVPFATGVADGPDGVLIAGTVERPTPADPGREAGGLWYSPDGDRWSRLAVPDPPAAGPGSTFDAVGAVPGGWLVAGTRPGPHGPRPAVWMVDGADHRVRLLGLLPAGPAPAAAVPTSVAVTATRIVVAGRAGTRAALWEAAPGRRGPGRFSAVAGPAADVPGLQTVRVASGPGGRCW